LLASFLPRLVAELPWRALLPPEGRILPTRVSNADLAQLALALPWLAALALMGPVSRTFDSPQPVV
jgi:hypothetical protein